MVKWPAMILLYTLIIGGMLWAVALQTSTEPVANRRIFGEIASILYVVAFAFVWLTTLSWCAVERQRVFERAGWQARDRAGGLGWIWQGWLILFLLWAGAGALGGPSWTAVKGPMGLVIGMGGYAVLGLAVVGLQLPRRLGKWLAPFVPLVMGGVLYLAFLWLMDWAAYGTLVPEFHAKLRSIALFVGLAAFVALLLSWLMSGGRGEEPAEEHVEYVPRSVDIGWALMPMAAPVVGFACLHYFSMDDWWSSSVASHGQVGLMFHAMLVPIFPAGLLVAWGLDRRDGSPGWWGIPALLVTAMVVWCFIGPEVLWSLHEQPTVSAEAAAGGAPTDPFWAWDRAAVTWVKLPVDGLVRATSAMLAALSLLATTLIFRAGRGETRGTLVSLGMLVVIMLVCAALVQDKFGPMGAPLGVAVAAFATWLYELWEGGERHASPGVQD